ncbi:hypothetical protein EV356DRAFT_141076 [Viridothelium virens]|uniref:Uncharacterized protein n=1 Tax=Viridothelium virens TaxID=1048519 RepID=A0A6A6HA35_VIRVR|nr:hypothetical protein EV356DRAFT_141076 [Viridothelium virens]
MDIHTRSDRLWWSPNIRYARNNDVISSEDDEKRTLEAWLTIYAALKCSEENLDDVLICQNIASYVDSKVAETALNTRLRNAKKEMVQANDALRWKNTEELNASKSLRKSATFRVHAPSSTPRCNKSDSRTRKALLASVSYKTNNTASILHALPGKSIEQYDPSNVKTALDMATHGSLPNSFEPVIDALPRSHYEGRQLFFKMSCCNGISASNAAQRLQERFPIHRGDLLWFLDQFLLEFWP